MQRFEPALCQCSFGLLCCASGMAIAVWAAVFVLVG